MNYKRRVFQAVGSVLNIAPKGRYQRKFVSDESDSTRLAKDWNNVGQDLSTAIEKFNNEQIRSEQGSIEAC